MAFCELAPDALRLIHKQTTGLQAEVDDLTHQIDRLYTEIEELEAQRRELEDQIQPDIDWMRDEKRRLEAYCNV